MARKEIYLNEELMKEAVVVPNFSNLISELFRGWLESKKTKEQLKTDFEKVEEEKNKIMQEKEKEEQKIVLMMKEVEDLEKRDMQEKEKQEHRLANKISNIVEQSRDMFKVELEEKEAVEYLNGHYDNIKQYLKEKGKWKEEQ